MLVAIEQGYMHQTDDTHASGLDGVKIADDAAELLPLEGSKPKYGNILAFYPRMANTSKIKKANKDVL